MNVGSEKVVLVNCLLLVSRVPWTSYGIDRKKAFCCYQMRGVTMCLPFVSHKKSRQCVLFARVSNENGFFSLPHCMGNTIMGEAETASQTKQKSDKNEGELMGKLIN